VNGKRKRKRKGKGKGEGGCAGARELRFDRGINMT
jgi:hypothetical protein